MNLLSFLPPGLKVVLALFLGTVGVGGAVTTLSSISTTPPNPPSVSSLISPNASSSPSVTNHGQQVRQAVIQCRAAFATPSSSGSTSSSTNSTPTAGKPADPGAIGKCVSTVAKDNHGHSLDNGKSPTETKQAGETKQAAEPRGHSGSHDKPDSKSGSNG